MKAVIGALRAVLGMDTVAFEAGVGRAQKGIRSLNRDFQSAAKDLEKVGKTMSVAITAPLVAFGAITLKAAANFEEAMGRVQAATGATSKEFADLTAKARLIGSTTQFTATEAAGALEMLAKNGLNVTQILNGAADATVALAAANGAQLAPAADVVTDVMNQFGIKAEQLGGVVDTITGTLVASKFGFDDYRLAIGQAGGVAGKVGVSFQDFNTALAVTSSSFASGSDAGTSFKTFLTKMAPTSEDAAKAMKLLGLSFFDAKGNMVSMEEAAARLQKSFKGLNDKSRINLATQIFGTDSMRTALALADAGAEGVRKMAAEIAKVSANDQAAVRMKGFNGAVRSLRASIESLAISIGNSGLLEWATNLAKSLTVLVQRVGALSPDMLKWGTIIAGVAAAIGPLALALSVVVGGFGKMTVAVARLIPALAPLIAILAPLAGTAGLLALAAAGLVLFSDKIPVTRDGSVTLADAWNGAAKALAGLTQEQKKNADAPKVEPGAEGFDSVKAMEAGMDVTWGDIARKTAAAMDMIAGIFAGSWAVIESSWATSWDALKDLVSNASRAIVEKVYKWAEDVLGVINWLREKLGKEPLVLPPLEPWVNSSSGKFKEAGVAMADAWNKGFQQTFFSDSVRAAIDAARDAALLRGAKAMNPFPESGTPSIPVAPPTALPKPTGGGGRDLALPSSGANQLASALKRIEEERKALDAATAFLKSATGLGETQLFKAADELARIGAKTAELLKDQDPDGATAKRIRDQVTALENARSANQAYADSLRYAFQIEAQYGNGKMVFTETMRQLNDAMKTGALSQDAYAIAVKNAKDALQEQELAARGAKGGLDGYMAGIQAAAAEWAKQSSVFELGKKSFEVIRDAATEFSNALFDADADMGKILGNMSKRLASFAMEALVMKPLFDAIKEMVSGAFSSSGSTGGSSGGGMWGSLISGAGSMFSSFLGSFAGGMASGGDVQAGSWYQINEKGQEFFAPGADGQIIPHDEIGGGGGGSMNVTQNINVQPDVAQVTRAQIMAMKPDIARWGAEGALAARTQGGKYAQRFNR